MKNKKKGFTIVELVIVIAVIGVLAAVLIPVFTRLIRKSKVNTDTQLIRNLNTALSADSANGKHKNMTDALKAAEAFGYDVSKINASATNNEILWDSKNDVFCYLNDGGIEYIPNSIEESKKITSDEYYKLWKIYDKAVPANNQYSIYCANQAAADSIDAAINAGKSVSVGVDMSPSVSIGELNYVGSSTQKDVVLYTRGGALTINAKVDNVSHFGNANSINIIDVAEASYHENGIVKFIEISAGHIVLEAKAEVTSIHFTATGEGDEAKFQNAEGKKISIDLSNITVEVMPAFSRDAVTIGENGTYVAEVKIEATEYIWLFGQGIKEQMVVTTSSAAIADGGTLKTGIEIGAEDGSVAEQIANPAKRNDQGQLLDSNDQVIDLTEVDLGSSDALDAVDVQTEEVASKEDVQTGATLFAGGSGTQSDPFLIVDYDTFQHVSDLYDEYYYYKVKDGTDTIDCKNWIPVNLNGSLNGNGVKLLNIDDRLFLNIGAMGSNGDVESWSTTPVTVGDFDCYFKLEGNMGAAGGMAKQVLGNNVTTLKNINIYGQIVSGHNSGAIFSYTTGNPYDANQNVNQEIYINDCMIYATLVSTSTSVAVVTGYPQYCNPNLLLVINNPDEIWQGSASNPGGTIKFISMTNNNWVIPEGGTANRTITCNKLGTVTLTKNEDGSYNVAKSTNATTVKVYISGQLTETDANGNQTPVAGITMAIQNMGEFDLNTTTKVLDGFNSFSFTNKAKNSSAKISNNKLSVSIGGTNNYTFGNITLVILECDANGNVLSYATKNIVTKTINGAWTIQ